MAVTVVSEAPSTAKRVCVISGDVHIHQHQYGNPIHPESQLPNRVHWGIEVLKQGAKAAASFGVPLVINGDLTHVKNSMDPVVTKALLDFFNDLVPDCILIPGNHEKPDKFQTLSTLEAFVTTKVRLVVEPELHKVNGVPLLCCPFAYDHKAQAEAALKAITHVDTKPIFVGHFPVDGANLGKHTLSSAVKFHDFYPEKYTAVLFNDIHKHQPIGSNGYHLGATMQNNFGEADYDVGWWLLSIDGSEVYLERVPVTAPRFFYTDSAEAAEKLRAEGHYARVRPQTVVKTIMAEQEGARIQFDMQDLDTTLDKYIDYQVEEGKFLPTDKEAIAILAKKALRGGK